MQFGPNDKNSVLLGVGLSFSLYLVIQADTPIKQCCNFSRDSLSFETDICEFDYHRHNDGGLCQN